MRTVAEQIMDIPAGAATIRVCGIVGDLNGLCDAIRRHAAILIVRGGEIIDILELNGLLTPPITCNLMMLAAKLVKHVFSAATRKRYLAGFIGPTIVRPPKRVQTGVSWLRAASTPWRGVKP